MRPESVLGPGSVETAPPERHEEPFVSYLIKLLITDKGFQPGTVAEAAEFVRPGVFVLSKSDGMAFHITCVVDAETDPERRFHLSHEEVLKIGSVCTEKYAGSVHGQRFPTLLQIIEVRKTVTDEDRARVAPFTGDSPASLVAFLVDTSARKVERNRTHIGYYFAQRFLEKALQGPRMSDDELRARVSPDMVEGGFPFLTLAMLAVLIGVFAVEVAYPVIPAGGYFFPNIQTLIGMGGLFHPAVAGGDWYRLLTAALLHGSVEHLVLNGIALVMAGFVLENLLGRAWLFALFLIGAVGGSLLSLAINPPGTVSVGASGAITGLLAAATIASFRLPDGPARMQIFMGLIRILIPALLPLAVGRNQGAIDYAAHLGGALSGGVIGVVLLNTWRRTEARPRFGSFALALSVAGLVLFGWSGLRALESYQSYSAYLQLMPDEQAPKTDEEVAERGSALAQRYPEDPRTHYFAALAAFQKEDAPAAEAQLREALALVRSLKGRIDYQPEFEHVLRALLARSLLGQDQVEKAREAVLPICQRGPEGQLPEELEGIEQLCP